MDKIEIDSKALDYRIYVHDHFSKSDFDGWVINKLNLKKGLLVLDVGCGSGKHLFEIASKIGASGSVVGIDTSLESLRKCENKIKERNAKNISVLQCDLSEIGDALKDRADSFDRVLSSFAIYYTKNAPVTFGDIFALLSDGGSLFMCGPTKKNNLEFLELVQEAGGTFSEDFLKWSHFLEHDVTALLHSTFQDVHTEYFNNPIEFPNAEVLVNYWKATPLYDKKIENRMRALVAQKFKQNKVFVSNKVIIGISCTKHVR